MKSRWVRQEALGIIVTQLAFVVFLTIFVATIWGTPVGGSFLFGGLISPLANSYFCFRVFSQTGARAANKIVSLFYRGEAVKIAMSAVGFYAAFSTPWVSPQWVLIGYIAAQAGFAFAAVRKNKSRIIAR